jgi:hypothetical protein
LKQRIVRVLRHPLSPFKLKTLYSIVVVVAVLAVGTEAIHIIEGWGYIDSFYFISLIATAQGPTASPKTDAGKIFASLFAFVSVGVVVSALVFVFGPMLGSLVKIGFDYVEGEERKLGRELNKSKSRTRRKSE